MPDKLISYDSFDNQIGGHQTVKGVRCMVADQVGHLLKYLDDSVCGRNEETFYKIIFNTLEFMPLREFVPRSYGFINNIVDGKKIKYLKIENLLHGLDNPNIIDIKIGRRTYDPFASKEKIEREETKFVPQKTIGFRLSGLKAYNSFEKTYYCYDGSVFRSCACFNSPEEKTIGYLKKFFGLYTEYNDSFCEDQDVIAHHDCAHCSKWLYRYAIMYLIKHMIEDLEKLSGVIRNQNRITFYASSILLAYDTTKLKSLKYCRIHDQKHIPISSSLPSLPNKPTNTIHTCTTHHKIASKESWTRTLEKLTLNNTKDNSHSNLTCGRVTELDECSELYSHVQVPYSLRMIDFGHTYIDLHPGRTDENYLFGIDNVINYLKIIKRDI